MEKQEKVITSVTESKTASIPLGNHSNVTICQCCLLCNNSRPFINGYPPGPSPWVCDECKEAIAFIKDFKASTKQLDSTVPGQQLSKTEIISL